MSRREERTAVYVISVAAELAGVHPQTLRVYERKGLLSPERTSGNTRRYSLHDIERLRRIQELTQEQGVNLAGAKMVLRLEERLEQMRADMERMTSRVKELETAITREMQRIAQAGEIVPARAHRSLNELWDQQRRNEGGGRAPIELGPTR